MKKRRLAKGAAALISALALCAMSARAENIRFSAEDCGYEGVWELIDERFEVFLPEDWLDMNLTAAQREEGAALSVCDPPGKQVFSVNIRENVRMTSDQIANMLEKGEYQDVRQVSLNGVKAVSALAPGEEEGCDVLCLFICREDHLYTFGIGPVGQEDASAEEAGTILYSVSPLWDPAQEEAAAGARTAGWYYEPGEGKSGEELITLGRAMIVLPPEWSGCYRLEFSSDRVDFLCLADETVTDDPPLLTLKIGNEKDMPDGEYQVLGRSEKGLYILLLPDLSKKTERSLAWQEMISQIEFVRRNSSALLLH